MRRKLAVSMHANAAAALLLIPMLFAAAAAAAAARTSPDDDAEKKPSIFLVLVHGEPLAAVALRRDAGGRNATWHDAQRRRHDGIIRRAMVAAAAGGGGGSWRCRKLYSFHHAVDGFAVHATAAAAERLRAAPEVAAVEEDAGPRLMTTYTPRLLGLPRGVWRRRRRGGRSDGDGEGVVVGVVDTGVDPAHPSFAYVPPDDHAGGGTGRRDWPVDGGACDVGPGFPPGSCNGKIVTARYFAAGAAAVLPLDASRDLSPFDTQGHGRLAVYKAVYPAGGTMADLISAIDQATQDKVDVLVLSVGPDARPSSKVTFLSILDVALLFARRAGVFVVQAAGNRGPAEASVVSYSPWVLTAAAGTTGRSYTTPLLLGDGRRVPGLGFSAPTLQRRLVAAKDAAALDAGGVERAEECQDAQALLRRAGELRGAIVVCSFSGGFFNGTSTVAAILDTARALGFAGFVLVADERYGDFVAQPLPFPVPGVMVPRVADAAAVWSYYAAHTVHGGAATVFGATAAIAEGRVAAFTRAAPAVARYSSRGPDVADGESTPADVLKPDVLAPGDQIWAAWSAASAGEPILAGGHFALLSGTSMAAPHVAGVAALIKRRHPSWSPAAIASALSTTARRHDGLGSPIMAEGFRPGSLRRATPFDCGAGFMNAAGALDPGLVVVPEPGDYVRFLCSLPQLGPGDVRGATGAACPPPSLAAPADLNLPSVTVAALRGSLSVRRTVTNVAGSAETYLCSALPPAGVAIAVRPASFEVAPGETRELVIELVATTASGAFGFGEVVLTGSLDHVVRLPLAVRPIAMN
ncbi:hypothetical protein ACP4OV_030391 [Aristida adscensionis]